MARHPEPPFTAEQEARVRAIIREDAGDFDGFADRAASQAARRFRINIPIRLACCPTCSRVPGSVETALCTRTDCGLADRHHEGRNAA